MESIFHIDTFNEAGGSFYKLNSPSSSLSTYEDLHAFYEQHEAPSMDRQQRRNRKSALNKYLVFINKTQDSDIGQELGDDRFLPVLAAFLKAGEMEGLGKGTLSNRKLEMLQWAKSYKAMCELLQAPRFSYFFEALKYYFDIAQGKEPNINQEMICRECGLSRAYISRALSKIKPIKFPDKKYLGSIARLEVRLGAPVSSLTRFVDKPTGGLTERADAKINSSAYGEKMSKATRSPYRMVELPASLVTEVKSFIKFKTAPSVIPLNRNETWRTKPKAEFRGSEKDFQLSSVDGKTFAASADGFVVVVQSFFGALVKLGHDPAKFNLAYLTDFGLLRTYIDFMADRMGCITTTGLMALRYAQSLMLRMTKHGSEKDFGFLRQHPEYAERLPTPIPKDKWQAWCDSQTKLIAQYYGDLKEGKFIKKGRDPQAPLREILQRQHPVTALLEISDNMRAYFEKYGPFMLTSHRLAFQRDQLMFDMFPTQPLRIKMYAIMTYHKDNSGNLYQRSDGGWAIRFEAEDFKNEKGAASDKDYDIELEPELWPKIKYFLNEVRPQFDDVRPNVFVSAPNGNQKTKREDGRGDLVALSESITNRTRQFLDGCTGFGPHGVRSLVATDYIRNNPDGFQVAADMLHDRLETVLKHYAHLKAADGHKHYRKWFADVRAEWRKAV